MNKTSALIAALILVSGAAFAAEPGTTPQPNDTMGAKAKRGAHDVGNSFRQMGRDARNVGHDLTHRGEPRRAGGAYNNSGYSGETRAEMSGDSARRERMDAAYANWQGKR